MGFRNRLASVILPGTSGTVTFKYDWLGRRVQKAFTQGSNTTTTNYLYDGANSIEGVDQNGSLLARYEETKNIDEPLAELRSGATSYYEADGLGSVTSLRRLYATPTCIATGRSQFYLRWRTVGVQSGSNMCGVESEHGY